MQLFQVKIKRWAILLLLVLFGCGNETPAETTATAVAPTPPPPTPTAIPEPSPTPPPTFGEPSIGDSYAPELGNTGYDVQHVTLQIALDPAQPYEVTAIALLDAAVASDNLAQFSLDFIGFEISDVQLNGTPVEFERRDGKLVVTPSTPLPAGELFSLAVAYSGETERRPSEYVGFARWLGLFYTAPDELYILSEPDGSRYWFPINDHPRDKATYRFEVTVPEPFTAVANGTLIDVLSAPDSAQTYIWEEDAPMASYLATIAVGEYERLEGESPAGIPLRHYVFPTQATGFVRTTEITGDALDWMSNLFGGYPFDNFGYVTVSAPGVSLETQTMVLLSTGMIDETTIIHEMAHMWFGDWVSLDSWGEMWRNEGFATYVSIMWAHRDDPEGLELEMAGIESFLEDNGGVPALADPPPADLFGFNSYFGGALMVHKLRQEMGDEAFFAGLRAYFDEHGGGTASDEAFQAVMETAVGRSLEPFFTEWLE